MTEERGWRCHLEVLTGESLLVVLPHGDEIPQAGVELFHDGLKEKHLFIRSLHGSLEDQHGTSSN